MRDLQNKLPHDQICLYIIKVTNEATDPDATLTQAEAAELIYWARILDPSC